MSELNEWWGRVLTLSVVSIFGFGGGGCTSDNSLYVLNLGYSGGFLGGSKVIITINGKRPDFMGTDYSEVPPFSGTDMSYISSLIQEGENTIALEIVPSGDVAEDKKSDPFSLKLAIERVAKGDAVVTGAPGGIFDYSVELKPGDAPLKWEKTFTVKGG